MIKFKEFYKEYQSFTLKDKIILSTMIIIELLALNLIIDFLGGKWK